VLKDSNGKVIGGVEAFRDLTAIKRLQDALRKQSRFEDIVSKNEKMFKLFSILPQIAESNSTVLIEGASGTGKELFARALHHYSPNKEGPFVAVNCGALPDTLIESELFGYKAGAFTDARQDKPGRFAMAQNGTIFLDEIGDISPAIQIRLLRVLQEKVYEPLGATRAVKTNARVIAATYRNLEKLVDEGKFREDLYYRISEIVITLPPLRERSGEAVVLASHFLDKECAQQKKAGLSFSPDALTAIETHTWPGNVRELQNRIKRAVILAQGKQITASDLELTAVEHATLPLNLREVREKAESQALLTAFQMANGKISQAAKMLGITRPTFYALAKKYNLGLGETAS